MDNHHRRLEMSPLLVGFLGILAGATVVAICHCIIVLCNGTQPRRPHTRTTIYANGSQNNNASSQEHDSRPNSPSEHLTVRGRILQSKYTKECKEDLCAVCLVEFKEGVRVSVLPECTHIFHVACINKWLENHPNCPLCRATAVPPLHLHAAHLLPESGGTPAPEIPEFGANVV
ncbi:RING-H2 finger protein ATL51-like [Sesamum indicum]|uniref:RING-H2 finger protein ATL51-like n=1 Tax=Sesamum indicum TaxID=4182 RepID=A0A6I9U798_SESIN|nr:RING-H2 finger protein ATL51-like [Sesamum indicum]